MDMEIFNLYSRNILQSDHTECRTIVVTFPFPKCLRFTLYFKRSSRHFPPRRNFTRLFAILACDGIHLDKTVCKECFVPGFHFILVLIRTGMMEIKSPSTGSE